MKINKALKNVSMIVLLLGGLWYGDMSFPSTVSADEGGVSFWMPGQYGSLAAVPVEPGWSLALIYYHASVGGGSSKEFQKGDNLTLGIDVSEDLLLPMLTYVFKTPVFGGQGSVAVATDWGNVSVDVDAILNDPGGEVIPGSQYDSNTAFGYLFSSASLRWNNGNHNSMIYTMAGVPVGRWAVTAPNVWPTSASTTGRRLHLSQYEERSGVFGHSGLYIQLRKPRYRLPERY